MKILITGGCGYVGNVLINQLLKKISKLQISIINGLVVIC